MNEHMRRWVASHGVYRRLISEASTTIDFAFHVHPRGLLTFADCIDSIDRAAFYDFNDHSAQIDRYSFTEGDRRYSIYRLIGSCRLQALYRF
jgi:hypothetical protein